MALFLQECRRVLYSVPFALFLSLLLLIYLWQALPELNGQAKPPDPESYGAQLYEALEDMMPEAMELFRWDEMDYDPLTQHVSVFCDHVGIIAALVPLFVAIVLGRRDRRYRMWELIGAKRRSSLSIVVARYLSMVSVQLFPILLLAVHAAASVEGMQSIREADRVLFVLYSTAFLLSTVMMSSALGMFLNELTDVPWILVLGGLWWFFEAFIGIGRVAYSWEELNVIQSIFLGRLIYFGLSVVLVAASVVLYDLRRTGRFRGILHLGGQLVARHRHRAG